MEAQGEHANSLQVNRSRESNHKPHSCEADMLITCAALLNVPQQKDLTMNTCSIKVQHSVKMPTNINGDAVLCANIICKHAIQFRFLCPIFFKAGTLCVMHNSLFPQQRQERQGQQSRINSNWKVILTQNMAAQLVIGFVPDHYIKWYLYI